MPTTIRTLALAGVSTLGLLALAGCQDVGPGTIPRTPTASQGGGAAVVQGGTTGGTANARTSASPAVP